MATNAITQDSSAELPQPLDTTDSPTFDGITLNDQTSIRPTSVINNCPYALVFDEASTNLVVNPSMENNVTDGWALEGANSTRSRVTSQKFSGDASMEVVVSPATGSSGVATATMAVSSATNYVFSLFMKGAVGGENITAIGVGNVSGVISTAQNLNLTTSWLRYAMVITTGASDTTLFFRIVTTAATAPTWYIDAVQLEQKTPAQTIIPTSYLDGSFGKGYSWSGTAHNSSSSRLAGLHVLSVLPSNTANPFVIKPDGTTAALQRIERAEGFLRSADSLQSFVWIGDRPTISTIGGIGSLGRFENTGNGVSLWVKSNCTSEAGMIVEAPLVTTGGIFQVAAPTDITNFTGSYLRFFDKSNLDMMTVKRDTLTYGNPALGYSKTFNLYGSGVYSQTSSANLTGTVGAFFSTTLTGTGTLFTTELVVGDILTFTGSANKVVVEAIASDTSLTMSVGQALVAVTYQKKAAQIGMFKQTTEGPSGDHVGIGKADVTAVKYLTDADMIRVKQEPFVAGSGTITLTAASGAVTTSVANAGIAVGDWIHVQGNSVSAAGNQPLQVTRVVSTSSFIVRPAATTTQAAVSGWTYQKANNMTMPSANNDGFGLSMSLYQDFTNAGPSATTTETSIFSALYRVRSNTIATNRTLRISAYGTLSGANAAKNLIFRVKLGTTTIATSHAEVIADTSTNNWKLDVVIAANNSAAAQTTLLNFLSQSPTTSVVDNIIDVETSTVNMLADQDLDITAQWGVAASTLTCNYRMIEVV